jgi:hypothetical protein
METTSHPHPRFPCGEGGNAGIRVIDGRWYDVAFLVEIGCGEDFLEGAKLPLDSGRRVADTISMDWECPVGGQLWRRSCPFSFQGKTFQPDTLPGPR